MSGVTGHLIDNKVSYVIVFVLLAMGVIGGANGQQWLDKRIDSRMADLKSQISGISIRLLEQQMRDMQTLICRSPGERTLLTQMSKMQQEYRSNEPDGRSYNLPSCLALGVMALSPHSTPDTLALANQDD